jgi:hypothetical protein
MADKSKEDEPEDMVAALESDVMAAPRDFEVTQSTRVLELNQADLWLSAGDCSWHRPLFFTLREWATKNWRQRSEATKKKREEDKADRLAKLKEKTRENKRLKRSGKGQAKGSESPERPWADASAAASSSAAPPWRQNRRADPESPERPWAAYGWTEWWSDNRWSADQWQGWSSRASDQSWWQQGWQDWQGWRR